MKYKNYFTLRFFCFVYYKHIYKSYVFLKTVNYLLFLFAISRKFNNCLKKIKQNLLA